MQNTTNDTLSSKSQDTALTDFSSLKHHHIEVLQLHCSTCLLLPVLHQAPSMSPCQYMPAVIPSLQMVMAWDTDQLCSMWWSCMDSIKCGGTSLLYGCACSVATWHQCWLWWRKSSLTYIQLVEASITHTWLSIRYESMAGNILL